MKSAAVVLCVFSLVSTLHAGETKDIGGRLELFADECLIAEMTGDVIQHLHKPEPKEVVLTTDKPWEGNTCAYYTIFQDGDLYRMYYRGSHADPKTRKGQHREVTCYAESRDGVHWTKPELGLFEWTGSKANNIVLDGLGTHCFVAFKDANPDCEPEAKYKGISRGNPAGLYVFQSPDGIHWSQIRDKPVITKGAFDSQNLAFWDPHTEHYVDYHRTFVDGVRAIMTCTSSDFLTWTDPVLLKYPAGTPKQHLYTNAIRPYERAPHIRIGFPTRYIPQGSQVEPVFMSSRDGRNFHRWIEPVIPMTAPRDRNGNRSNYMANGLVRLPGNDREYAVYGTEAYYTGPDSRLRRFMYRIDGFVSVRGGSSGGELITKPLTFSGSTLSLNLAVHEGGSARVEFQTPEGKPLKGFNLDDSKRLTGDEISMAAAWDSGSDVNDLAGKRVRVRFELKNADLYSIRFLNRN